MQKRFSVASYSFHGLHKLGAMSVFQYFETIRFRYQLDTADVWNGMLLSYDEDYLKLVRQQMDERGLRLANLCCDWCQLWGYTPEEIQRQDAVAEDCLRAAEILGAETVRMDAGVREAAFTDEQLEAVSKKYDRYCQRAAGFGAKLGTENHWGATTNAEALEQLFGAVSAKNFGILLHVGNWANTQGMTKDPTDARAFAYDNQFASRAFHIHMMYEVCRQAEERFPALAAAGYPGVWSIESHLSTNEFNNVAYQLAEARRVLAPCDYAAFPPQTIPTGAK